MNRTNAQCVGVAHVRMGRGNLPTLGAQPPEHRLTIPSKKQFGPFLIDVGERVLQRNGLPVALTPKAFDLLAALLDRPGQLISKDELLQKVWPDTFVEEANLAYNVFALRKALQDTAENSHYIETVPKKGYRFTATVTPMIPANAGEPSADGAQLSPPSSSEADVPTLTLVANERPTASAGFTAPSHVEKTILAFRKDPAGRSQTAANPKAAPEDVDLETSRAEDEAPGRLSSWRRRWALLAVAPVLIGIVYVNVRPRLTSTDSEPPRALPLTSLAGVVRSPSLSPDGTYVAFAWTGPKQDNPDIYVQQIGAGSPPHRLTSNPGNDYSPSWSPDGLTIAFLRRGPAGGKSEIWRTGPLGGPERKVAEIEPRLVFFRPISLAWCPDSTCVLVTDTLGAGKPDAVFAVALATGEKRQVTHPHGLVMDADPAISPDRRSLIFRRDSTPFSGEFHRLALNEHAIAEGDPVRLTSTLYAGKPVWMPDSREILFAARGGLWRLDALTGGSPTRLPFVGQDGQSPVVSQAPDGRRRLVYVRSFADTNVWRVDTRLAGEPATSPPVAAIASTRSDLIPNLAPDGRRLVFVSDRSGESEFWVADRDGSNAFQLTSMAIRPGYPRWSPDGTLIAFHGDPDGRPDVLMVAARGGQPRTLTRGTPGGAYPTFSRDGQSIYFSSGLEKGESRIWKMPASGGAPIQVTDNAGALAIESYRGDLYYVDFVGRPGAVWRLPSGGGGAVKVLDGVVLGNFDVVEGGLYYIDRVSGEAGAFFTDRPGGETRLRYFDFSTSRSTIVARHLGSVGFGLSASRDGRTIFFSRVDSSSDELMLVESFR